MDTPLSQETPSLVLRLAGPSTGKAGLMKDQSEINKIIAEASKGSKFYENEKQKDKKLTERIQSVLKQRDEALQGVDLTKPEKRVDHLLVQLESSRDLSQSIVHIDMDAFYASVELLRNPALEGKPFGVGKGVLSTASYEARKYGVRSGMPGFIAKKLCPELILISNHFSRYSEMSGKVMAILRRYDPTMMPGGCDEAYLNITQYCKDHKMSPEECVKSIRETIHQETKLTASAGIAPNKMLAKICSDRNKPNGQFYLEPTPEKVKDFMRDLSIRKIPGIGRVQERLLDSIGIKVCGDVYKHRGMLSLPAMDKIFDLNWLLRTYLGIASNVVQPHTREEVKSIGAERTFNALSDKARILQKLEDIAEELEREMNESHWAGKTVTLKYKLDTYQVFTRAKSFDRWITKKEDLFNVGKELLAPSFPLTIRLIGLRVTKLKDLTMAPSSKGIQGYFGPATKKRRLNDGKAREGHESEDSDDDQIPEDDPESEAEMNEINSDSVASRAQPKPPSSKQSGKSSKPPSTKQQRPPSTSKSKPLSRTTPSTMILTCPICERTLETNNVGLNTHVDWCLSKGVIKEAQKEATVGSSSKAANEEAQKEPGKRKLPE